MKAIKILTVFLIFTLNSCISQKLLIEEKQIWKSQYELNLSIGKFKTDKVIKTCKENNSRENRLIRDNMRTGNIEYNYSYYMKIN